MQLLFVRPVTAALRTLVVIEVFLHRGFCVSGIAAVVCGGKIIAGLAAMPARMCWQSKFGESKWASPVLRRLALSHGG
jgi:hypothetical protein